MLSDMAAPTTGHRETDHIRTPALFEAALEMAEDVLRPGGAFVGKVFQGGATGELLARVKKRFAEVKHVKPPASRGIGGALSGGEGLQKIGVTHMGLFSRSLDWHFSFRRRFTARRHPPMRDYARSIPEWNWREAQFADDHDTAARCLAHLPKVDPATGGDAAR